MKLPLVVLLLILAKLGMAQDPDDLEWVLFHWVKPLQVIHHKGTYQLPGQDPVVFRTTNSYFKVPALSRVRVYGYNKDGKIETIHFVPLGKTAGDMVGSVAPTTEPDALDGSDPWLYVSDPEDGLTEEDLHESQVSAPSNRQEFSSRNSADPGRELTGVLFSLNLGIGFEQLASKGGTSSWSTNSSIGGTGIRLIERAFIFDRLETEKPPEDGQRHPWYWQFDFMGHNLAIDTVRSDEIAGTKVEEPESFFRTRLAVAFFKPLASWMELDPSSSLRGFSFGWGLELRRLPILLSKPGLSGAAKPSDLHLLGPAITLIHFLPLHLFDYVVTQLSVMPLAYDMNHSVTGGEGSGVSLDTKWLQEFYLSWWWTLGMVFDLTTAQGDAKCDGALNCRNLAEGSSQFWRFQIGIERDL